MKEQFSSWKPNRHSRARLEVITGVIEEYRRDRITMTLRQMFYQLVTKNIVKNTIREYKNLGELLSKARMAGLVDWNAIEDRVRVAVEWQYFDSIKDCVDQAADSFRLNRWRDQPEYVELWCEKDALSSVLRPICSENFAVLMVQRGYGSTSAMYESRNRINSNRIGADGEERDVHIIYLGDFDPSGEDMVRDIRERFETLGVDNLTVTKLALNPEQVKKWKLPPNPAKMTDSRASKFVAEHGSDSFEVDAIPPRDLQKMVRTAIRSHMDIDLYNAVMVKEVILGDKLKKAVSRIR